MSFWQEWLATPWYAKCMCYVATAAVLYGIANEIVRAS